MTCEITTCREEKYNGGEKSPKLQIQLCILQCREEHRAQVKLMTNITAVSGG